jgi:starch phosphorylase
MPSSPDRAAARLLPSNGALAPGAASVAYFTMEVALDPRLPTYSGGLGVLAGDFLCSAADLGLPLVAVTLAYTDGYFQQQIDAAGQQVEMPVVWDPTELLERLDARIEVVIGDRPVVIGAWQLLITGVDGAIIPVFFLDTDLPENWPEDRRITDQLYGGDLEHRLRQEVVLGIGGCSMLQQLGYDGLSTFHMNEGHAALLTVQLLQTELRNGATRPSLRSPEVEVVRARCVFTTHTPVPAGHDRFPSELVRGVLGPERTRLLEALGLLSDDELNMTTLGTALSHYVNAVSRRHAEVTRAMLPGVEVASITNGVHHVQWASPPMRTLFDECLPGWRADSSILRYASDIPLASLAVAHAASKRALVDLVAGHASVTLDEEAFTMGLARRVTPYKRALLLFSDPERLSAIAEQHGRLQIVCSGKAHPRDAVGKETITALISAGRRFGSSVAVVFLENYDLALAAGLCAGCDVWLNTPQRPLEASGTSGMKAAVNGVPSLSVLDGWWIEGCVESVTGWAIGAEPGDEPEYAGADEIEVAELTAARDAADLYEKLDTVVAPAYFGGGDEYVRIRRAAVALNGSFFSTDRMAREYARAAYGLTPSPRLQPRSE